MCEVRDGKIVQSVALCTGLAFSVDVSGATNLDKAAGRSQRPERAPIRRVWLRPVRPAPQLCILKTSDTRSLRAGGSL
jgi:hypothetical protein